MSVGTEERNEKLRQWKRDLDAKCSAWMESHPEGAETLNTSDILSRPTETPGTSIYRYENGTTGRRFADNPDPQFQSRLLPGGESDKIMVREIREGTWAVFVGTTMVDTFRGADGLQQANDKAQRLSDARQ